MRKLEFSDGHGLDARIYIHLNEAAIVLKNINNMI